MTEEQAKALRAAFPPEAIGQIPKGGVKLDYVGHAAVTDRLLAVDPEWSWAPPSADELRCLPTAEGMWIKLTVCGVTRYGFGDGNSTKEWIGDAIRNAAMRFGVALDLWSKEDLQSLHEHAGEGGAETGPATVPPATSPTLTRASDAGSGPTPPSRPEPAVPKAQREKLKRRCAELVASGVSVADEREARGLPLVDSCSQIQFDAFAAMVDEMFTNLEKPFEKPLADVTI